MFAKDLELLEYFVITEIFIFKMNGLHILW